MCAPVKEPWENATMPYEIKSWLTGKVLFTAEITCTEDTPESVKLGLAVKLAVSARAYLSGAYLSGADLSGADLSRADLSRAYLSGADLSGADLSRADLSRANLSGADLSGADLSGADLSRANLSGADLSWADLSWADLVDGGQRSDGYRFVGWVREGVLQVRAGCRNFPIAEARTHWAATRGGTPLGNETTAILDHIEQVARIRGLIA